jgi:hypothetical protein
MLNDAVYKKVEKLDDYMIRREREILKEEYVPLITERITQDYDNMLADVVTDKRSKTSPTLYRKDFQNALDSFTFVKTDDYTTILSVPDMENFPFEKGRLQVIKHILEGVMGIYVEVSEEQYVKMYGKRPIQVEPYDNTVPAQERIYLLKYTTDVQRKEFQIFRSTALVRYPFSNMPPIRLFDPVSKFVEENFSKWVDDIAARTQKEFSKMENKA